MTFKSNNERSISMPNDLNQPLKATKRSVSDRNKRIKRAKTALAAAIGGMLSLHAASPEQNPNTQQTNNTAPSEKTFKVDSFEVHGNTLLTPEDIAGVLTNSLGDRVTGRQIFLARDALNLMYRKKGWITASVTVPQQKITNGVVHLNVLEGRLSEINIIGNEHFSSNNILRALPSLKTNILLNSRWFGPELDRANMNSDRQIYPEIMEGARPGESALKLKVKDRLPLHGRLEINNQGTPGTPPIRVNASMQYNNLWQRDNSIGVQYGFTPVDFKESNPLPERFYDHPLIANYSAYYRLPLGSQTAYGERWEQNPSAFGYDEVTRQFKLPPLSGRPEITAYASRSTTDTGVKFTPRRLLSTGSQTITPYAQESGQDFTENANVGFRLTKPAPDFSGIKSGVSGGLDYKLYHLQSFNTNHFIFHSEIPIPDRPDLPPDVSETETSKAQPVRSQDVNYLPLSVRWDAYRRDKYGYSSLGLAYSLNIAGTLSDSKDFAASSGSQKSSGTYHILTADFTRDQRISGDWFVLFRASGQWANEPLISNEQFGIGGSSGVRGYEEGERYGDRGWKCILEPKTPMLDLGLVDGKWPMRVQGSIFTDYGESYRIDRSLGAWRQQLWGAGLGLSGAVGQFLDFRASLGWPLIDAQNTKAGTALAYFSIAGQF